MGNVVLVLVVGVVDHKGFRRTRVYPPNKGISPPCRAGGGGRGKREEERRTNETATNKPSKLLPFPQIVFFLKR